MEKNQFYRELKSLVIPIAVQHFMISLVSAADVLMLGMVDQTSLSASSLAGQIQFLLVMIVLGISAGTGILVAQYWGRHDAETIGKIMPIALRADLLVGSVFTILAVCIPEFLMKIYTDEPELITAGSHYLRAVAFSYICLAVSQVYLTLLKNTGEARLVSIISSTAVVLNIVLNAVLIFGLFGAPKLGIVGAAYATVISRVVELIWSILESLRSGRIRIRWKSILKSPGILEKDFWIYTIPALGASLVWSVAYSLYSVILGHMGSDAVAANSITSIIKNLVSCLIRGVSAGAGIMIGNLLGAGKLEKSKEWGARLVRISIFIGLGTGLIMMIIAPFASSFTKMSENAAGYLTFMMIFGGVNLMFQSVNTTVLDGIFCAGGDSAFDMIGNLFAMWLFAVPLGFLAAFMFRWPVIVVFTIVNLDEIVKIPAVYLRYKKYIWVKNLTREN